MGPVALGEEGLLSAPRRSLSHRDKALLARPSLDLTGPPLPGQVRLDSHSRASPLGSRGPPESLQAPRPSSSLPCLT